MSAAGTITYSHGQLQNVDVRPDVPERELWHIHYYTHPDHRTTWDIAGGKVLACYEQVWGQYPRNKRFGWLFANEAIYPVPIRL